jgi:hypothetical protein
MDLDAAAMRFLQSLYLMILAFLLLSPISMTIALGAIVEEDALERPDERIDRYRNVVDRSLFLPLGTVFEQPGKATEFKLMLTIVYDDGDRKALFRNSRTGQTSYIREGEKLPDGTQIIEILPKKVKMVRDGQELFQGLTPGFSTSPRSTSRQEENKKLGKVNGESKLPPLKSRPGTPEWREEFRKRKVEQLIKQGVLSPVRKMKGGDGENGNSSVR